MCNVRSYMPTSYLTSLATCLPNTGAGTLLFSVLSLALALALALALPFRTPHLLTCLLYTLFAYWAELLLKLPVQTLAVALALGILFAAGRYARLRLA